MLNRCNAKAEKEFPGFKTKRSHKTGISLAQTKLHARPRLGTATVRVKISAGELNTKQLFNILTSP